MFDARGVQRAAGQGGAERGLTLIELGMVVAVLVVLVAIAVIAVRGSTVTARGTTKAADVREVQKAVNGYRAIHPQELWPTIGKRVGSELIAAGRLPSVVFAPEDPASYVAIDWKASFISTREGQKVLVPDFLRRTPKHATATTEDGDGNSIPDTSSTAVWVLDKDGVVNVLLSDERY